MSFELLNEEYHFISTLKVHSNRRDHTEIRKRLANDRTFVLCRPCRIGQSAPDGELQGRTDRNWEQKDPCQYTKKAKNLIQE